MAVVTQAQAPRRANQDNSPKKKKTPLEQGLRKVSVSTSRVKRPRLRTFKPRGENIHVSNPRNDRLVVLIDGCTTAPVYETRKAQQFANTLGCEVMLIHNDAMADALDIPKAWLGSLSSRMQRYLLESKAVEQAMDVIRFAVANKVKLDGIGYSQGNHIWHAAVRELRKPKENGRPELSEKDAREFLEFTCYGAYLSYWPTGPTVRAQRSFEGDPAANSVGYSYFSAAYLKAPIVEDAPQQEVAVVSLPGIQHHFDLYLAQDPAFFVQAVKRKDGNRVLEARDLAKKIHDSIREGKYTDHHHTLILAEGFNKYGNRLLQELHRLSKETGMIGAYEIPDRVVLVKTKRALDRVVSRLDDGPKTWVGLIEEKSRNLYDSFVRKFR